MSDLKWSDFKIKFAQSVIKLISKLSFCRKVVYDFSHTKGFLSLILSQMGFDVVYQYNSKMERNLCELFLGLNMVSNKPVFCKDWDVNSASLPDMMIIDAVQSDDDVNVMLNRYDNLRAVIAISYRENIGSISEKIMSSCSFNKSDRLCGVIDDNLDVIDAYAFY